MIEKDTITAIGKRIAGGEKILEIVRDYQARALSDKHNIYLEVFDDLEEQSENAQALIDQNQATDLTGVPIAIKDNILFAGHKAGASSKMLEGYVASFDSTVVAKLKKAGAIIMGRTNMDEFAMGSSTENSAYGATLNPLNSKKVPGGSSGGSAAAVAAKTAVISLGSDTGGSIRQPAAFCGTVGLLPTYGSVSRHGLMAMGSSLDVIGPFANSISDIETVYKAIKGPDNFDSTSFIPKDFKKDFKKRLAVPKGLFDGGGIDPDVKENFEQNLKTLAKNGYLIEEVEIAHFQNALATYYILMPAEVSSNLARFDGVRYGPRIENGDLNEMYTQTRGELFGREVRRRILLGTYILSHGYYDAYYNQALKLRNLIKGELNTVFEKYDAILTPTTPTNAFGLGEKSDPLEMYLSDLFTVPANIAQIPALSVPSGKTGSNLQHSIQLMGNKFTEEILFEIAKIIENNQDK